MVATKYIIAIFVYDNDAQTKRQNIDNSYPKVITILII